VVLSHSFGTLVRDDYGVRADRVRVIPPGVDLERFTPDRDGARRRWACRRNGPFW
jgi:glycosyltransferase involved in cell wall biosynthesis